MLLRISGLALALLFAPVTIPVFHNGCASAQASGDDLNTDKIQEYLLQNEGPVSGGLTRLQRTTGYKTNLDALVANFKSQPDSNAKLDDVIDKMFAPIVSQDALTKADKTIQAEWVTLKNALHQKYGQNSIAQLTNLPAALQGRKDAFTDGIDQWIAKTLAGGGFANAPGTSGATSGNGTCWRLSYRNLKRACRCQQCK